MCGLLVTAAVQRLNLWNRVVVGRLGLLTAVVGGLVWYFARLDAAPFHPRAHGVEAQ
jgi:hypothetical protein